MKLEQRAQVILKLSKFTGIDLTSHFLRETSTHFHQAHIPRIHNLSEGIYKPASDKYAFCIWSRSAIGHDHEIYQMSFSHNLMEAGSCIMLPKAGLLTLQ